jgi:hypothetical protein
MTRTKEVNRRREADTEPTDIEITVRSELARVRARLSVDPAVSPLDLSKAWTSPSGMIDEDEAQFVDTLADCLSVGLPLNAAFTSWMSGDFVLDDETEEYPENTITVSEMRQPARHRIVVR